MRKTIYKFKKTITTIIYINKILIPIKYTNSTSKMVYNSIAESLRKYDCINDWVLI